MGLELETERERRKRRHQRTLFDGVADRYEAYRPGYPGDLIEFVAATAAAGPGSAVLEVGCGTGQLTQSLARFGFSLTAIDIGPSMIAAARRRLGGSGARFQLTSFEDFEAADATFDLIISGTAFHWIDPEVRFRQPARLLRPGGWLALLGTGEFYDDPIGAALDAMWAARSDGSGAWAEHPPTDPEVMTASGLFAEPVHRIDERRKVVPAEVVLGVENTRATSLSWPEETRREFTEELRQHLRARPEVALTQRTTLTMARVLRSRVLPPPGG